MLQHAHVIQSWIIFEGVYSIFKGFSGKFWNFAIQSRMESCLQINKEKHTENPLQLNNHGLATKMKFQGSLPKLYFCQVSTIVNNCTVYIRDTSD